MSCQGEEGISTETGSQDGKRSHLGHLSFWIPASSPPDRHPPIPLCLSCPHTLEGPNLQPWMAAQIRESPLFLEPLLGRARPLAGFHGL